MSSIRDLIPALPPIILASFIAPTSPATPLAECRIMGSSDPTYGTASQSSGWVPRTDGRPFAVLSVTEFEDDETKEPNRLWSTHCIEVFIAIDHSDTPGVAQNFNDLANAFIEAARQAIPANRLLYPYYLTLSNVPGDVIWYHKKGSIKPNYPIFGIPYYGVLIPTYIRGTIPVSYQG